MEGNSRPMVLSAPVSIRRATCCVCPCLISVFEKELTGVVWCGVVWCGVVWCGVVCGVWCGVGVGVGVGVGWHAEKKNV